MSNIQKVNISLLKAKKDSFDSEKINYLNSAYNPFFSSYLKHCSDVNVLNMANNLGKLYNELKDGYDNISTWWNSYNKNIEGLNNFLSGSGSSGAITESSVRNYISSKINLLEQYNKTGDVHFTSAVNGTISTNVINNFSKLYEGYNTVKGNLGENLFQSIKNINTKAFITTMGKTTNLTKDIIILPYETKGKMIQEWWNNQAKPWIIDGTKNIVDTLKETGATISNNFEASISYLQDKKVEFSNWINDQVNTISSTLEETKAKVCDSTKSSISTIVSFFQDKKTDISDWWNNQAKPCINNIGNTLVETGAKICDSYMQTEQLKMETNMAQADALEELTQTKVGSSITKMLSTVVVAIHGINTGTFQFVEGIVDFVVLLSAASQSVVTGVYDLGQMIYGNITGNEWESETEKVWEEAKGFVSHEWVNECTNYFYDSTSIGKTLKENAIGYESVRSATETIGYICSLIAVTIATGGVGSATNGVASGASGAVNAGRAASLLSRILPTSQAIPSVVTAGAVGTGKGTERAWNDGASITEGLTYGVASGLWEALQYYIGMTIGKTDGIGNMIANKLLGVSASTLKQQIVTSLSRVLLDGVDGGIEGFIQPALQVIYKDGYQKETDYMGTTFQEEIEFSDEDGFIKRWSEIFDDNGGWGYVMSNAAVGSFLSAIGEIPELSRTFKNSKVLDQTNVKSSGIELTEQEYQLKALELEKLLQIKQSAEYLEYMDNAKKGYAQVLRSDFDNLDEMIMNLRKEIDDAVIKPSNFDAEATEELPEIKQRLSEITEELPNTKVMQDNLINKDSSVNRVKSQNKNLNNFNNNGKTIKKEILDSISDISDSVQKLRKLYMELNNKLHYSMDYLVGDENIQRSIMNSETSFDNLYGSNVVCKGWSELYRELLIDAGFNPKDISIQGNNHKWIEVDLGNKILIADATEKINKYADLVNTKTGSLTEGFVILPKQFTGSRLKTVASHLDFTQYNLWLQQIDEELGYATKDGYFLDTVVKTKNIFGDSKLINKLFGDKIFEQNVQKMFDMEIPSNMDGFECWGYYKKLKDILISKENSQNISVNFFNNSTPVKVEPITVVRVCYPDSTKFLVYSESSGKIIFDNINDYNEYFKTLNIVGRR